MRRRLAIVIPLFALACHPSSPTSGTAASSAAAAAPTSSASAATAPVAAAPQDEKRLKMKDGKGAIVATAAAGRKSTIRLEHPGSGTSRELLDFNQFNVEPWSPPARRPGGASQQPALAGFDGQGDFRGEARDSALQFAGGVNGMVLSPDDKVLYVLTNGWATTNIIYAVDLTSGKARFVSDSNRLQVISDCTDPKLIGKLVLQLLHTRLRGHAVMDYRYLGDEDGTVIGVLGRSDENVARFLALRCGRGTAAPAPQIKLPNAFKTDRRVECKDAGLLIKHDAIDQLDGTTAHLFTAVDAAPHGDTSSMEHTLEEARELCPTLFR
jgi:hypothetical protein